MIGIFRKTTKLRADVCGFTSYTTVVKLDTIEKIEPQSGSKHKVYVTKAMRPNEGHAPRCKYIPHILPDVGNNVKLTRTNQRISLSVKFLACSIVPSYAQAPRMKTQSDRICKNVLHTIYQQTRMAQPTDREKMPSRTQRTNNCLKMYSEPEQRFRKRYA